MDTKPLESFAKAARRELIAAVEARMSAVLATGSVARSERADTVRALEAAIGNQSRKHVVDKVAYTWFNRLVALRFMDARGYTDAGVVSPAHAQAHGQPEILADAKRGDLDGEVVTHAHDAVISLLDGTRRSTDPEGEAYALLLMEYCRHWNKAMPFMFEAEGAYTELLMPSGLLADGSVLSRARDVLTEEVCQEVEVIGWLYPFYISDRKDEVFAGFKKNKKAGAEEIPAATQLFTPHWIVRYLVENSLGRLWLLNRPDSPLVDQMDYYIAPVDEETDFLRIAGPEELTVIDPACGSGHMLTYAFDLLYAMYEEEGRAPADIPGLILAHNLHGTEIDPRAGALAAFALTMKARAKQRTFFGKRVKPKICVIKPIALGDDDIEQLADPGADQDMERAFWRQFEHADMFGALIRPDATQAEIAAKRVTELAERGDLFATISDRAAQIVEQAEYLARKYAVAIANPPYMGSKQMNALLSQFMKDDYPTGKADLMAAFMVRAQEFTVRRGTWAMINLPSWMSLKSFEDLRHDLLRDQRIVSMVHLGRGIFGSDFGSVAFVIDNAPAMSARGVYRRLFEQHVDVRSVSTIEALFLDAAYNRYEVAQADFAAIPGSPIVYWLSEKMRAAFSIGRPIREVGSPKAGMHGGDVNRFVRHWHEVSEGQSLRNAESTSEVHASGRKWVSLNKGGSYRKWYGNHEHVVAYDQKNYEVLRVSGNKLPSREFYFLPSVSWSKVSSGAPSFRAYPPGFIFADAGNSIFATSPRDRAALIAFANSQMAFDQLAAVAPTLNFEAGQVAGLPMADDRPDTIVDRVGVLIEQSQTDWDSFESSWNFTRSPLVDLFERD